jgi:ABC-2 type transport system ATP-binding protein
MIEINNISKSFGKKLAVDDLSLIVSKGEFFGFLGPNGAGKTTTIKILTGLLRPDKGTASISGIDVAREPEKAKAKIGYIPDSPYLYEKLTGREFLEFCGGLYGVPKVRMEKQISWLLELFGMDSWADRRCEEYSHGMRQKVVFGSAFVHDPEVLIIDEPMVGLDPQSMRLIKDVLKLYASRGTTVFVSTHLLTVAEELCDRIGIVNNGKLVASGTLTELHKAAASEGENLEELFLELTGGPRLANLPPGFDSE